MSTEQHASEALALAGAVERLRYEVVAAYVPFGSEPGSVAFLDRLRTGGSRVLLPVVPDLPGPLDWAEYDGPDTLTPGLLRNLLEPSGPRLGTSAIADAGLVLVPALAVDDLGVRLGRGGGYYDRTLAFASPDAARVAVVRDTELVPRLPADTHDVLMTGALCPGRGLVSRPV